MNAALKSDPMTYILDAGDCLNRAKEILEYVIDMRSCTSDDEPGLGWILAEVQTGISDAMALLNSAHSHKAQPVISDPEQAEQARVDRLVAESIAINTMKAAIATHEARLGGAQ